MKVSFTHAIEDTCRPCVHFGLESLGLKHCHSPGIHTAEFCGCASKWSIILLSSRVLLSVKTIPALHLAFQDGASLSPVCVNLVLYYTFVCLGHWERIKLVTCNLSCVQAWYKKGYWKECVCFHDPAVLVVLCSYVVSNAYPCTNECHFATHSWRFL